MRKTYRNAWVKPFLFGVLAGVICFYAFSKIIHWHSKSRLTSASTGVGGAANGAGDSDEAAANCPRVPANIEAPLLPPPSFSQELPDEIEASKEGGAFVAWDPVDKALRYEVVVTDSRGARVNRIKTPYTDLTLKDFRTGDDDEADFFVSIATVNVDGKSGAYSKSRKIVVRERPDITAPTIKSIKTED